MSKRRINAIKVNQPLGSFFIASIKAKDLLQIAFSEPLEYVSESGEMKGNQRVIDERRLKQIGAYIDTAEMTFPNTIILSVNHNLDGSIIENTEDRWELHKELENYFLSFPTDKKSASIIDGQHRINGFKNITKSERLDIDIVCSIFFELPNPYQAYLFATINGNQKRVDKGLALEQFGYYVAKELPISWTPEKLAASISRKLNFEENSPLKGLIRLSPMYNNEEFVDFNSENWIVSTATIMEGILSLVSSNYKRDRIEMMNKKMFQGRSRKMIKDFKDYSPLRNEFIEGKDKEISNIIFNFFSIVRETVWKNLETSTYINKTVGVQALFSFLKECLKQGISIEKDLFSNVLNVDFNDNYFQASGIGKTRIQNVLLIANKLKSINALKNESDIKEIKRILKLN